VTSGDFCEIIGLNR